MTKTGFHQHRPSGRLQPDTVRAGLEARYPAYQYCMVEFLTEHLADLSRVFDGDLQEALVLAVIGQVFLHAHMAQAKADAGAVAVPNAASISASRISDVTGIPRQTVRRKLQALEARGWIERGGAAAFRLRVQDGVSMARSDLNDLDRRGIARTARLFCALDRVLGMPEPQR